MESYGVKTFLDTIDICKVRYPHIAFEANYRGFLVS